MQRKVLRQAIRAAMKPVLKTARATAPKKGGALRKAIKLQAMRRSRKSVGVEVGIGSKNFTGKQFYGSFQEWGWKTGKRGTPNRRQVEGRNYISNAFDKHKQQSKKQAQENIIAGIMREAGK